MYAWQRVWKLPRLEAPQEANSWHEAQEIDWPAVQSLHGQIVPALLQPIESLPRQACGLVCRPQGGLQAYVAVISGAHGIWLQPLVPPDSGCSPERLAALSGMFPAGAAGRSTSVCVPTRPGWNPRWKNWVRSRSAAGGHGPAPGCTGQGIANGTGDGKGAGQGKTRRPGFAGGWRALILQCYNNPGCFT